MRTVAYVEYALNRCVIGDRFPLSATSSSFCESTLELPLMCGDGTMSLLRVVLFNPSGYVHFFTERHV